VYQMNGKSRYRTCTAYSEYPRSSSMSVRSSKNVRSPINPTYIPTGLKANTEPKISGIDDAHRIAPKYPGCRTHWYGPFVITVWARSCTRARITSISCAILGSSLIYLIVEDKIQQPHLPPSIQDNWNNIVENLTNTDEKAIVTLIIAEGGTMFQSQLVEKSGFSKTKVSLVLDRLEARNVLERRRHGMSNVIVLKSATK
ncbi:MAG: hypothetical protein NWE83_00875, partial [Candidatus Bathyarchaeota archaeon]|nr:hypothetical protein [Candidatus Bathyarchaeota archaeon]